MTLNDYDVRVVKAKGEFTRHSHPETDEFFLVLRGRLTIRMDDGDVQLGPARSTSWRGEWTTSRFPSRAPRCC